MPNENANDLTSLKRLEEKKFDATIRDIVARENPVVDGWSTEQFSELAGKQLKAIGTLLLNKSITATDLSAVCQPGISSSAIRPLGLSKAFQSAGITVLRGEPIDAVVSGRDEVASALNEVAQLFNGKVDTHFKFKI
ncbi:MAG: hypothetical protein KDB27_31635, partial [Planctomycetales bacterium]|nr:hypothetical protein [Planctomycetales bacterium]